MEFVTQRRTWKETEKRRHHDDAQYAELPRSWSTRAERELQEMDYMFRINRRQLRGRKQLQGTQISYHWQTPPKSRYQLCQHEEESMQRTSKRRVMVVSNPDPTDDSEGEFEMMARK